MGTYRISSCTESGFFADNALCAGVLNSTPPVTFILSQTGQTVAGTFSLGSLSSSQFTATIGSDGSVTFAAPVQQDPFTIDATWTITQPSTGALSGQTRQVWRAAGQSGEAILQGSIVSVTRTSAALSP